MHSRHLPTSWYSIILHSCSLFRDLHQVQTDARNEVEAARAAERGKVSHELEAKLHSAKHRAACVVQ